MATSTARRFEYKIFDFIEWMDAYGEVNPALDYFGKYGLRLSVNVGILAFVYYRDLVGLNALGFGLACMPIMYNQGYEYQGIVKSMAVPRGIATAGSLLYFMYRLTAKEQELKRNQLLFGLIEYKNKITIENNRYLYIYCLFSTLIWSVSFIFDIVNVYEWFIKKDKKVLRNKKKLQELKEMKLIHQNVDQYQWIYRNGQKIDDNVDDYGFIIHNI